jgi:hypothetical protein
MLFLLGKQEGPAVLLVALASRPVLMVESWARREARSCCAVVGAGPSSWVTRESLVGSPSATSGPGGRDWGSRTEPSSAKFLSVMLPFLMVIDMKRSSRERPWPVGRGQTPRPGVSTISSGDHNSWSARGARSGHPDRDDAFSRSTTMLSDLSDVRSAAGLAALDSAADPDAGRVVRGR